MVGEVDPSLQFGKEVPACQIVQRFGPFHRKGRSRGTAAHQINFPHATFAQEAFDEEVVQQGLAWVPVARDHGLAGSQSPVVVPFWGGRPSRRLLAASKPERPAQPARFIFCHNTFAFVPGCGPASVRSLNLHCKETVLALRGFSQFLPDHDGQSHFGARVPDRQAPTSR